MSLRPDDRSGGRSRSKSPGRTDRDRSRSRSNVRVQAPEAPSPPTRPQVPYDNGVTSPTYEVRSPTYEMRSPTSAGAERSGYFGQTSAAPPGSFPPPLPQQQNVPYPQYDSEFTMGDYKDLPPHERPGYVPPSAQYPTAPGNYNQDYGQAYNEHNSHNASRQNSYGPNAPQAPQGPYQPQTPYAPQQPGSGNYKYAAPEPNNTGSRSSSYTYQYAQPPDKITYTAQPQTSKYPEYTQSSQGQYPNQPPRNYPPHPDQPNRSYSYDHDAQVVDITPRPEYGDRKSSSKSSKLSVDTRGSGGLQAPNSAGGLTQRVERLSVSGNRPDVSGFGGSGGLPPPSPLLEAYHGTYQQMSPMPLALRPTDDDDLESLEPLSPAISRSDPRRNDKLAQAADRQKEKKKVKVYNEEADAQAISQALRHSKVDTETIIDILSGLSHDQIVYLRKEYKKQVKVSGKGVNLSKHIKTKIAGNFGKAVYVVALGRWESEGYWANFFYQSHSARRELLIESLMGRTNGEIWNIKDEFKDKRYSDNLVTCMEKELKMDKFRTAVLMVLEERRQEEQDVYPLEYRNRDVDTLRKAITAKQGGESTMLEIIVRRSDAHLREVLKTYQNMYQESFPRAALEKSNNLVGEIIAHILNGVINKPARDALLLRHAINDIAEKNKDEELRYELLISRLVRLHWDKAHLERVKREYYTKYKKRLDEDIDGATSGDFAEFMVRLCEK